MVYTVVSSSIYSYSLSHLQLDTATAPKNLSFESERGSLHFQSIVFVSAIIFMSFYSIILNYDMMICFSFCCLKYFNLSIVFLHQAFSSWTFFFFFTKRVIWKKSFCHRAIWHLNECILVSIDQTNVAVIDEASVSLLMCYLKKKRKRSNS